MAIGKLRRKHTELRAVRQEPKGLRNGLLYSISSTTEPNGREVERMYKMNDGTYFTRETSI